MPDSKLTSTFPRKPRAMWKYAASFLKRDWKLEDYPVITRDHGEPDPSIIERLRPSRWTAQIDNWAGPMGTGSSEEEAMALLQKTFTDIKASPDPLPRPGTGKPIVFASSDRVDRYPELRDDFIHKVLNLEWAFVSDESSLWHFHAESDNSHLLQRVGEVYGVDVTHVNPPLLRDIFEEIMEQIREFPEDTIIREIRLSRAARDRYVAGLPSLSWNRDPYEIQ